MAKIVREFNCYELDEYPSTCSECPFLRSYLQYYDITQRVLTGRCYFDYMGPITINEFDFISERSPDCEIAHNPRVSLYRKH